MLELGKAEESLAYLEKAVRGSEKLCQKNPTQKTKSVLGIRQRNLARALRETNRFAEALVYEGRALDLNRALYNEEASDKAEERQMKSLSKYADSLLEDNRIKDAYAAYTEGLGHCKSVCEKNDSIINARIYVRVLTGLYLSLRKLEQFAEAEEYLLLAKEQAKKLYERSGVEKDKKLLDELDSYA